MPESIANLPPDAEIARLNSRRCDPRWEGFKGFLMGALPALALGGLAGVAIGALAMGGAALAPLLGLTTLGTITLPAAGLIAASVAGFSALISGAQGSFREVREAHMKNYAIDRAIQTVHQNALAGIAPQQLPQEIQENRRSSIVDRILGGARATAPSTQVERLGRRRSEQSEQGSTIQLS